MAGERALLQHDRVISRQALAEGWPIVATTLVVGMAFGIAAREAGLEPLEASGMSTLMFAGASQFAAVDLLARDAAPLLIVLTVLLLNLRHLLMAAALRAQLAGRSLFTRLGAAYLLTDESFAMGIAHARRGGRGLAYYATFAAAMWLGWNTGTLLGATVVSDAIDPRRFGLDFAITAAFIAIVVLGIRDRTDAAVANDGKRYAALPTAFVYRKQLVADCTCNGKSPGGLVRIDAKSDPTLRPGDIVATDDGLMSFRGSKGKTAEFTPIQDGKLANIQIRPAPSTSAAALTAHAEAPPPRSVEMPAPNESRRRAQVR